MSTVSEVLDEAAWTAAVTPRIPNSSPWASGGAAGDAPAPPGPRLLRRLRRLLHPRRHAAAGAAGRACQAILAAAADITLVLAPDGTITYASPAATRMLGRPSAWLPGHHLAALVHPQDRPRLAELIAFAVPRAPSERSELRVSHMNGQWVEVEAAVVDMRGTTEVGGMVVTLRDIADRKALDEELRRLALHDPLTNLANRALFRDHVEHALARNRRAQVSLAVLFIDLDGFKTINDSLGHAAGDQVLITIAGRLRSRVRPGDTAARLGGDEFAVLMENSSERDATVLAQRLLEALRGPIFLHGREVVVAGSVGIALSAPGLDADGILRNADVAMYRAKATGKGRHELFKPEMQHAALKRLVLEGDLRHALERSELEVHYQPIIALGTGEVAGMEALVRWRHPERGLLAPGDFIALAEESGLIRPLGRWVLQEACRQVQRWSAAWCLEGAPPPQLRLCVNASVRQIEDERFAEEVAECLAASGMEPESLTLEITESLFLGDFDETVAKLCALKQLGIKLAIDDFGTGYSSLNYLRYLPIDILKIDKSFVDGVTRGTEQSAVARAVLKLARTFGLQTVAEGIEQPEQLEALRAMGADLGQGYHLSPPLENGAMEAFLAAGHPVSPGGGGAADASPHTLAV